LVVAINHVASILVGIVALFFASAAAAAIAIAIISTNTL